MSGAGERVELVYRATAGDFHEALRVSARASAVGRWGQGLLVFSAGAGVLVTAVSLALGGVPDAQVLVMPGAAIVGLVLVPRFVARRLHRRAAALGPHRAVLDPWGVTVEHDEGTDRSARWSQVSRYAETSHTFVLFRAGTDATRFTVLPKSGLQNPGDAERVRALLDGHDLTRS